ncbi:MAG TPA: cytidylate kinase-like family protein [Candidatus Paceibacterota bacterium]|nr:cytidylate kinase-like family protein [Candidatus Paceibacterota bacterium]
MKKILAIDREFGAGGSTIAEKLAARLGWKLLDQDLTREIARLANVPPEVCERREERVDPWLHRLTNLIWRGSFERNLPPPDMAVLDTNRLVALVQQVVERAIAAGPCVIVGRGAPYFLRERTDTFCVFLYASRELRFRRVLKRIGDEREAVTLVDTMDEERRKFIKHQFGHEWPNRQFFHVMLNTALGDDLTVETILNLLNAVNRSEAAGKP